MKSQIKNTYKEWTI